MSAELRTICNDEKAIRLLYDLVFDPDNKYGSDLTDEFLAKFFFDSLQSDTDVDVKSDGETGVKPLSEVLAIMQDMHFNIVSFDNCDGKPLDLSIAKLIGEGSFNRVYKTGLISIRA